MRPCTRCMHSAVCLPNSEEFPMVLFQRLVRVLPSTASPSILNTTAQALLKKFKEALPENCPLWTPGRRQLVQVLWERMGFNIRFKLVWPKPYMLGGYSIGIKI